MLEYEDDYFLEEDKMWVEGNYVLLRPTVLVISTVLLLKVTKVV